MAEGPGRYDDVATLGREQTEAAGVIVIVIGGKHGDGFSVQAPAVMLESLPPVLRDLTIQIEKDLMSRQTTRHP